MVAKLEEEAGSVDDTMGVYRIDGGGKSLTESRKMEKPPEFCRTMDRNLNYRHDRLTQEAPRPLNSAISWRRLAKSAVYLHSPLAKRL